MSKLLKTARVLLFNAYAKGVIEEPETYKNKLYAAALFYGWLLNDTKRIRKKLTYK